MDDSVGGEKEAWRRDDLYPDGYMLHVVKQIGISKTFIESIVPD